MSELKPDSVTGPWLDLHTSHLLWIRLQPKCPGYGSTTLYFIEQSPISCLLSPVSHLPSFISCLLSHVSHLPSSVSHLLSPVSHLSSPVSHLPSFVSCIPSTVSHLLQCFILISLLKKEKKKILNLIMINKMATQKEKEHLRKYVNMSDEKLTSM